MKKVKITFWIIILVIVGVFAYQNKILLMTKQSLIFKVPFYKTFHTPDIPLAVLFLVFFLTGFLIAYFISLYERFKSKKTIKDLNAANASQLEELAALKSEMESLRSRSSGQSAESEFQSSEAQHTE